jgi:hypothetical protein
MKCVSGFQRSSLCIAPGRDFHADAQRVTPAGAFCPLPPFLLCEHVNSFHAGYAHPGTCAAPERQLSCPAGLSAANLQIHCLWAFSQVASPAFLVRVLIAHRPYAVLACGLATTVPSRMLAGPCYSHL